MKLYFLLIDAPWFHESLTPALAASWRWRSLRPVQDLIAEMRPTVGSFAAQFNQGKDESLINHLPPDMPFDRDTWRALVGEMLLYGARDMPELPNILASLKCILGSATHQARLDLTPIEQIESGCHDLVFGAGYYRPDQAGLNTHEDVIRLADYLEKLDPTTWLPSSLEGLPELPTSEEREGELEYVRQEFPNLRHIYHQARALGQVIVCERF